MGRAWVSSVLILGASLMQLPAIMSAKELGLEVFLLDGNPNAPYRAHGDHFKVADLKDVDKVVRVAKKWHKKKPFSGVFTAGTDFSYTVSCVAHALGIQGLSREVAYCASNKESMRECFKAHGVSSPSFYVTTIVPKQQSQHLLGYPVVVKPVDNMGARGIRLCVNFKELVEGIKSSLFYSKSGKAIIEEYIQGDEYSIDSIVEHGEITITGFAKRHIFFQPWFIEMGHTIPARIDLDRYNAIVSEFKKGVKALGIDNGVAKGDMKWGRVSSCDTDSAYVGEIAARLSGGYMSGWSYPYSSGVELTKLALCIALGKRVTPIVPTKNLVCSERAFISSPGVVKAIQIGKNDGLYDKARLKDIFIRVKPKDYVDFPTNNVEKCGNILYVDESYDTSSQKAQEIVQSILVRLEPNCQATKEWMLYGKSNKKIPMQFHCSDDNNSLTLFSYMPKRNCSEGQSSILFFGKELELTGMDWMGRNSQMLVKQLCKEGQFLFSSTTLKKEQKDMGVALPSRLFYKVLEHGSHQGFYWLLDYLDLLFYKKRLQGFLKQWSS